MKIYSLKNLSILMLLVALMSCDDNEIVPDYEMKGTSTSTVASITVSNTKPVVTETITTTVSFVNPSDDPVKSVVLKAKVGSEAYIDVQSFDESSAAKEKKITHEVQYSVSAAAGTAIVFDMVITSQKEFPQVIRTTVTVK